MQSNETEGVNHNQTVEKIADHVVQQACFEAEEEMLTNKLKGLCDHKENQKELKETNPKKAAKVIHQLGRLYRSKSRDKISLIRSAILFNAALARNPDNVADVEADLRELCEHVLVLAGARQKQADLINQSKIVRKELNAMRKKSEQEIKNLNRISDNSFGNDLRKEEETKISAVRTIQKNITDTFLNIMHNISQFCEEVVGAAPCRHALVAIGSPSRSEVTLYSDFESLIVLEDRIEDIKDSDNYEAVMEHFRWLATIFQLVVVNIGETVIYDAAIESLKCFFDAFTPSGVGPDSFFPHASHNPIGRPWKTELIKPMNKMLKYMESDENLKNGYHLGDIIVKNCYVSGDKALYKQFTENMRKKLNEEGFSAEFIKIVKDDLQKFNVTKSLMIMTYNADVNIKRILYRATGTCVAALERFYGVASSDSYETIDRLSFLLPSEFRHKFKYAMALSCEVRLKTYSSQEGREDSVPRGKYEKGEYTNSIIEMIGSRSARDFLIIVIYLQDVMQHIVKKQKVQCQEETKMNDESSKINQIIFTSILEKCLYRESLETVLDKCEKAMCMLNCSFDELMEKHQKEAVTLHMLICTEVAYHLGEHMEALQYCQKTLAVLEQHPTFDVTKVFEIVYSIGLKDFREDEEIQEKLNSLSSKRLLDATHFAGVPERAIRIREPIPNMPGRENHQLSPSKTLLRSVLIKTLDELGKHETGWPARLMSLAANAFELPPAGFPLKRTAKSAANANSGEGVSGVSNTEDTSENVQSPGSPKHILKQTQNFASESVFDVPVLSWKDDESSLADEFNEGLASLRDPLAKALEKISQHFSGSPGVPSNKKVDDSSSDSSMFEDDLE